MVLCFFLCLKENLKVSFVEWNKYCNDFSGLRHNLSIVNCSWTLGRTGNRHVWPWWPIILALGGVEVIFFCSSWLGAVSGTCAQCRAGSAGLCQSLLSSTRPAQGLCCPLPALQPAREGTQLDSWPQWPKGHPRPGSIMPSRSSWWKQEGGDLCSDGICLSQPHVLEPCWIAGHLPAHGEVGNESLFLPCLHMQLSLFLLPCFYLNSGVFALLPFYSLPSGRRLWAGGSVGLNFPPG